METLIRVDMAPYLESIVEPTIGDVLRRYGGDVDLDDLRQEAAVWWYGPGQTYVREYIDQDEKHGRLRRSIWRWCARYAETERAARRGYHAADQMTYSPGVVLRLLPAALDPDGLPDGGGMREGSRPKGNLAEGGDTLAMLIDVRRAVRSLAHGDRAFLVLAEDLACDWERISQNTNTLPDSVRRRHARIAERMARFLNNDPEDDL